VTECGLSQGDLDRARRRDVPDRVEPMLATLTDERFSDDRWIFERKLDGERCLARRRGGEVVLRSRAGHDLSETYPEVVEGLGSRGPDLLLDGEVVAFERGVTSFARLQGRMQLRERDRARRSGIAVWYYLFDLLFVDGFDVRPLPLRRRKALLRHVMRFEGPIRFTPHRNGDGEAYYRDACQRGWEGLVAKRADAPYRAGRSRDWRKFKCAARQELVIGGFTEPGGSRTGFGALLVGYHRDGDLVYAGKVGTGFDAATLRDLRARLDALGRDRPPFAAGDLPSSGVHWVRPELVGEVEFTEWTADGRLRHPRFVGLRRDQDPADVVRERPVG